MLAAKRLQLKIIAEFEIWIFQDTAILSLKYSQGKYF